MTRFPGFGAELLSAAAGLLLVACGGEGGPRPDRLHGGGTPYDDSTASLACQDNPYATYPNCFAPDLGSGPFSCADDDAYDFLPIENFETGVTSDGGWYTNNEICYRCVLQSAPDGGTIDAGILPNQYPIVPVIDPAVCADRCDLSQEPTHFAKPIPATEIQNGGRCGSRYAMRVRAPLQFGPFTDWGFKLEKDMSGSPFDAATPQWEGVSFWARVGPASRGTIRLSAADQYTWEKYVNPETGAAFCLGQGRPTIDQYVDGGSTDGCDQAGAYFNAGPDWQFFTLPFSEMRQAGWGKKEPYFDVWGIMAVGFLTGPGAWWDVWIDDVAWYRRKP